MTIPRTSRIRYRQVRVADNKNDQKSALEILGALAGSLTQEDLQVFLLSQIKRIIHGDNPGHWQDDFIAQGTLSLRDVSFSLQANCLPNDHVGDVVYIRGDSVGEIIQVERADIGDAAKMPGIGVITSKSSDTECIVIRGGIVPVVGFLPGKLYFVGPDGRPSPISPIFRQLFPKSLIQPIGIALSSDRLLLHLSFNLTRVKR